MRALFSGALAALVFPDSQPCLLDCRSLQALPRLSPKCHSQRILLRLHTGTICFWSLRHGCLLSCDFYVLKNTVGAFFLSFFFVIVLQSRVNWSLLRHITGNRSPTSFFLLLLPTFSWRVEEGLRSEGKEGPGQRSQFQNSVAPSSTVTMKNSKCGFSVQTQSLRAKISASRLCFRELCRPYSDGGQDTGLYKLGKQSAAFKAHRLWRGGIKGDTGPAHR